MSCENKLWTEATLSFVQTIKVWFKKGGQPHVDLRFWMDAEKNLREWVGVSEKSLNYTVISVKFAFIFKCTFVCWTALFKLFTVGSFFSCSLSVNLVAFLTSLTLGLDDDCLFFNCFSYHSSFLLVLTFLRLFFQAMTSVAFPPKKWLNSSDLGQGNFPSSS